MRRNQRDLLGTHAHPSSCDQARRRAPQRAGFAGRRRCCFRSRRSRRSRTRDCRRHGHGHGHHLSALSDPRRTRRGGLSASIGCAVVALDDRAVARGRCLRSFANVDPITLRRPIHETGGRSELRRGPRAGRYEMRHRFDSSDESSSLASAQCRYSESSSTAMHYLARSMTPGRQDHRNILRHSIIENMQTFAGKSPYAIRAYSPIDWGRGSYCQLSGRRSPV